MNALFTQRGAVLPYTNPSASDAVDPGSLVRLAGLTGVLQGADKLAASAVGEAAVKGVFRIRKKEEIIVPGLPIWWDADGSPKVGTASSGAATAIASGAMAAADFVIGSAVAAAAAADEYVEVELNAYSPAFPAWANKIHTTKTDHHTVTQADGGTVLRIATDAKTFTLPAVASGGADITFVNDGADGAVALKIEPNSDDKIMGGGFTAEDDKYIINTKTTAKRGDFVTLTPYGADGWFVTAIKGVWAREA